MQGIERDITGTNGRYRVEEAIGRGGLGEVFRAHDTQLNRKVAIKRLHQDETGGAMHDTKVIQEARHLAALNHPNIVTVFDYIEDGGDIVVVMELLRGRTLQEIGEKAPLLLKDFAEFIRQTLEGLIAAHSIGMLHRDIKPGNLMLIDLPSGAFQMKILDFGLAKVVPEPSLQTVDQGGGLLGSVFTMAPEQLEGRPLDGRTDLYSLGCVSYFALTTHYPFTGASIPEVICAHLQQRKTPLAQMRPDLPAPVCQWVEKLMNVDPAARPESAVKALEEFNQALAGQSPVAAAPTTPAPVKRVSLPPPPPAKKFPALAIAAVAAGVLGLATAAVFLLQPSKSPASSGTPVAAGTPAPAEVAPAQPPPSSSVSGSAGATSSVLAIRPNNRSEFAAMVGQDVTVEGMIERTGVNKTGTIRFLNFAGSNRGDLALVFFTKASPDFTEERLSQYIGKDVRVRGKISLYEGTPQIVVDRFSQIEAE